MTYFPETLRIFGYASLCPDGYFSETDCDLVGDFARSCQGRVDTLAEEYHPSN